MLRLCSLTVMPLLQTFWGGSLTIIDSEVRGFPWHVLWPMALQGVSLLAPTLAETALLLSAWQHRMSYHLHNA